MTEAYPLQWPAGRPRCSSPARSKFGERSVALATDLLLDQLRMLGASHVVLSTNISLTRAGRPASNTAQPADKGVAVYFTRRGKSMCFACDRWDRVQDNIYAVTMTIDALRGIERWGSGDMVEQAFTGFVALPAPRAPHEILGVRPDASPAEIDEAHRARAKTAHPDHGGKSDAMAELNAARDTMKRRPA